jgi:hypothetical protein
MREGSMHASPLLLPTSVAPSCASRLAEKLGMKGCSRVASSSVMPAQALM